MNINETGKGELEWLYEKYKRSLYACIFAILKDEHLSEDAFQTTICRIIKNADKFDDIKSDKTRNYIHIMARNVAIDYYNERKREESVTVPIDEAVYIEAEQFPIDEVIAQTKIGGETDSLIAQLNVAEQELLYLKYGEGLVDRQIAEILNIKPDNVRKRLSRARNKLKQLILSEQGKEED